MEFKEFEEKVKEYFEETGAKLRRKRRVFCECVSCNCCCFDNCELDYQQRKDIKNLYTDENVAKLEKYLEGKKMGNFKVRCVNTGGCNCYTKDKIYEIKDGDFIDDINDIARDVNNIEELDEITSATWELVEDTDTNEHCLECQPNHKSCNTCYFYEEEESEYPCNTCVSGLGDNEMYVKGAGCHNCGRTFEVENTVISPCETICKLEKEIARLTEKAHETQENNENVIMELTIERDNMQKALGEKDTEIAELEAENEERRASFAKLYQEKEEQDKILKEKNNLIACYRDDLEQIKRDKQNEIESLNAMKSMLHEEIQILQCEFKGYKEAVKDILNP